MCPGYANPIADPPPHDCGALCTTVEARRQRRAGVRLRSALASHPAALQAPHDLPRACHPHAERIGQLGDGQPLTDCGLRLGEVLGLSRADFDGEVFQLCGSAHAGVFTEGDQPTKRHVRTVPCPPSTAALIRAMPTRIDTEVLFPTAQREDLARVQLPARCLEPSARRGRP